MIIYKHTGNGFYIGSCVIVAALSEEEAKRMIRTELNAQGLFHEPVNIEVITLEQPKIIHSVNGDY